MGGEGKIGRERDREEEEEKRKTEILSYCEYSTLNVKLGVGGGGVRV